MALSRPIVLASASPRRRRLLLEAGIDFTVCEPPYAEPTLMPATVTPRQWAEALAYFKARSVAERVRGHWVLGADTLVCCAGQVLGKPLDEADARRMLALQARHPGDVITGVALVRASAPEEDEPACRRRILSDVTRVWMYDAPELWARYLASGQWRGKAGAYGIQEIGVEAGVVDESRPASELALVERIEGSFSNVVGLPVERLGALLSWARGPGEAR
ncbi:MAG: Maf family protein [Phycisphaerae bacterium]|nr:Maf family protein [Phycisphaerae bacterium]MCZ2401083.1 Maf family protein [Phycisphaerae bacterium]NUQ49220.1 Maf family protein [Phycisphaerae bacterium]